MGSFHNWPWGPVVKWTHPWKHHLPTRLDNLPCSHGTYQHEAITSRSRQLLMMGTWFGSFHNWHSGPVVKWTHPWKHYLPTGLDNLPCSHGTYQHEAITSRSHQLLMMGTWLPETCWATIRREIKNTKSDIKLVFLIHTTHSVCGSAALVTQHANAHATYYVVTCGLFADTTCFHIISLTAGFSKKKNDIKCMFLYYLQILSETPLILRRDERHSSYYHKCPRVFM